MAFYIRLAFTSGLALRIKGAAYFTKSQRSETDNIAKARAYRRPPAPRHLLTMSHVLDDNVASENRGGRRKFGETEDIALLMEIVANEAHVCRRGNVTGILGRLLAL
jgi:hypothetical protein